LVALTAFFRRIEEPTNSFIGKIYITTLSFFLSNALGKIQSQILFSVLQMLRIDLLVNNYTRFSFCIAYITMSSLIGLLIFCFFKLQDIFKTKEKERRGKRIIQEITSGTETNLKNLWLEKKYEDFKDDTKIRFFFMYSITTFNESTSFCCSVYKVLRYSNVLR